MLRARVALGKVWCGRTACRGRLPSPAPRENRRAPNGQYVFEMAGWQPDELGRWHRVSKPDSMEYRKRRRAEANTRALDAGKKGEAWEPAKQYGRRAISLPANFVCATCDAMNAFDMELLRRLESP